MRILIIILMLVGIPAMAQTTSFTEFYCTQTGTNVNAGSTTNDAATFSGVNGNYTNATQIWFLSGADLSGVSAGMWASVYTNSATVTNAAFVCRISAVDNTAKTITLQTNTMAGVAPLGGVGNMNCRVGGAWRGPYLTIGFPFNFVTSAMTNASGNTPRVNFKSDLSNSITAAITHSLSGPIIFQGYTASAGDLGHAIIDGGTAGTGYVPLTISGNDVAIWDMTVQNNGANGFTAGLVSSGTRDTVGRCIVNNIRGMGIQISGGSATVSECEAYKCDQNGNATRAGIHMSGNGLVIRCVSHDNSGEGFVFSTAGSGAISCLAVSNVMKGFSLTAANADVFLVNCDSYGNASDGLDLSGVAAGHIYVENCNFVNNAGFGVNSSGSSIRGGGVFNCGFGSGTRTNTSGNMNVNFTNRTAVQVVGVLTYSSGATPYVSQSTGNYSITNTSAAKSAGRGTFTQTSPIANTVSKVDIGAGQHVDPVGGAAATTGHPFLQ